MQNEYVQEIKLPLTSEDRVIIKKRRKKNLVSSIIGVSFWLIISIIAALCSGLPTMLKLNLLSIPAIVYCIYAMVLYYLDLESGIKIQKQGTITETRIFEGRYATRHYISVGKTEFKVEVSIYNRSRTGYYVYLESSLHTKTFLQFNISEESIQKVKEAELKIIETRKKREQVHRKR